MALNSIEQLKIIAGVDGAKPTDTDLLSLLLQSGTITGRQFIVNVKTTEGIPLAESYKNKMLAIILKIFKNDQVTLEALRRVWVAILGDTSATYAQVQSASDSEWITFAQNNIDEAMEFVSGISIAEKTAYDNIVV